MPPSGSRAGPREHVAGTDRERRSAEWRRGRYWVSLWPQSGGIIGSPVSANQQDAGGDTWGRGLLGTREPHGRASPSTARGSSGPSAGPSSTIGVHAAGLDKGTRTRGARSCRGLRSRQAEGPGLPGEKPGPRAGHGDSGVQRGWHHRAQTRLRLRLATPARSLPAGSHRV